MTRPVAAVARSSSPGATNTLTVPKPIRFCIIEFLGATDSNVMRRKWLKWGFKDVTPLFGKDKRVSSFRSNPKIIKRWPEFQKELVGVDAEWILLSGHHGREFATESSIDPPDTGFFNYADHHGRWSYGSYAAPNEGALPDSVYMTSARRPAPGGTLGVQDNPLFGKVHKEVKGVMLIACNTLSYPITRLAWRKYFPNAVIIGMLDTTKGGKKGIAPFLQLDKRWFSKPPTNDKAIRNLAMLVAKKYYKRRGIGVQYKEWAWSYDKGEDELWRTKIGEEDWRGVHL